MSKHTPGPWRQGKSNPNNVSAGSALVCRTFSRGRGGYEAEANARLIAAAPELLAACVNAAGMIYALTGEEGDTLKMIRAAIAKAEGGQDE